MKVGTKIKVPKRQFMGDHPYIVKSIKDIVDFRMKEVEQYFASSLTQRK